MPQCKRLSIPLLLFVLVAGGGLALRGTAPSQATSPKGPLPGVVVQADDFPSLQAAIDAVPVEGGTVLLGPRRYVIHQPLRIRHEDFLLQGSGPASVIENRNRQGAPALVIEPPAGFVSKTGQKERLWRVELSQLRLEGNPQSGHGVVARRVQELFIHDTSISHHGGDGIHCLDCYEDMRLADCLITYNKGAGLFARGNHDTVVADCQFEENQDAVRFLDGFNLCMTGNNLDDHLRHGVVVENTYGSIISSNMIEECQGWAVVLDRDCYGIAVSANVLAHEFTGGVDLRDAHGCTVSGNAFPLCKQAAVRVGAESSRNAITGNSFCDSFIGQGRTRRTGGSKLEARLNQAAGVVLQDAHDLTITGNTFSGQMPKALAVHGRCRRVVFTGNLVTGTSSDHRLLQQSVLQGNIFQQE